jgi:hypothetical protein
MKLNLKQVLQIVGLPRPNFDSARTRFRYGFMSGAMGGDDAVADYENARARYGFEHVTALRCILHAKDSQGMSLDMADSIISNNFGELVEAVRDGSIDPDEHGAMIRSPIGDHFLMAAVFFGVGRHHVAGKWGHIHDAILRPFCENDMNGPYNDNKVTGVHIIDATVAYQWAKAKIFAGLNAA